MCTALLPPGGYPTAVNKYIISYHIISYHIISITDNKHSYAQNKTFIKTSYMTITISTRNVAIFCKKACLANTFARTSAILVACIQNFYGKRNANFTEKKYHQARFSIFILIKILQ
jgi:hypothetical protein